MAEREEHLFDAKLAEQAERYEEMVESMKKIMQMNIKADDLTQDERNLISVGYKNLMSNRRQSWRQMDQKLNVDPDDADPEQEKLKLYHQTIADEIHEVINKVMTDVVQLYTEGDLKAQKPENLVFFYKMQGDYFRYGAEISKEGSPQRSEYMNKAKTAYDTASTEGKKTYTDEAGNESSLEPTNPILLGLALNYSVFHYEISDAENSKDEAKALAKNAFDKALEKLDMLPEDQYKDATLIMQLLKDNLTLWSDDDRADDVQVEDIS